MLRNELVRKFILTNNPAPTMKGNGFFMVRQF
jgi:hypothetical protein